MGDKPNTKDPLELESCLGSKPELGSLIVFPNSASIY